MVVHDHRVGSRRNIRLTAGDHRHAQRVVESQTVLRQLGSPYANHVVVVNINLVVGEIIIAVEDESGRLVAVQRVGERLGHLSTTVDGIMQLERRNDVGCTIVGQQHIEMFMTEVAVGDRMSEAQQCQIMDERMIHHRTNHEATRLLRHVCTVGQIIESTVTQRGLHLSAEIITVCQHLQTNIELTGSSGKSKVLNRNGIPLILLQRVESNHFGCSHHIAGSIRHKSAETIVRISDVSLIIIVFHCRHGQILVDFVTHARTDDVVIIAYQ